MDAMKVFSDALSQAKKDGYDQAISEMISFLNTKSNSQVNLETREKISKLTKTEPVVSDEYCKDCLTLKTLCACKETFMCECAECECVAPVKKEGAVCPACRKH